MADEVSPSPKKRRIVKNPESFREKAQKANVEKPSRFKAVMRKLFFPFKWFFGKLFGLLRKFFGLRIFKPFRKPVRIIGKILVPPYFRNSYKELKLVTWPNWKLSRRLTYAVLMFAIIFGLAIAGLDYLLEKIFRYILLK